jgi:hypothetical protein
MPVSRAWPIDRDGDLAVVAKRLRPRQSLRQAAKPAIASRQRVAERLAGVPQGERRLQPLTGRSRLARRTADQARAGTVQRRVGGVDQVQRAQLVQHGAPVAIAEGVDHDTIALEQQRDGTVGGAVTWRGHIGAAAARKEVAAESLDDGAQGHGSTSTKIRPPSPSL